MRQKWGKKLEGNEGELQKGMRWRMERILERKIRVSFIRRMERILERVIWFHLSIQA